MFPLRAEADQDDGVGARVEDKGGRPSREERGGLRARTRTSIHTGVVLGANQSDLIFVYDHSRFLKVDEPETLKIPPLQSKKATT